MKRITSCAFAVLLHPTTTHLASIFFELLSQSFLIEANKYANYRIIVCCGFYVTSGPRPMPQKLGRELKWQHFDLL